MKQGIHPQWFPEATVICACGNTWTTGATRPEVRTDICSACHPFFTGEQRIVDTEGQVDRFMKRLQQRDDKRQEVVDRVAARTPLTLPLAELNLSRRHMALLEENGVFTAGDFIQKMENNEEEQLLEIPGVGRKVLADIKKALRLRGYELPAATTE